MNVNIKIKYYQKNSFILNNIFNVAAFAVLKKKIYTIYSNNSRYLRVNFCETN